ncbi:MAG: hypothetical protein D6728_12425 [Cyanobacteria bacterium J055]|nr:MAG: hypothetical protein D6728_12425 [Cyanobacteria bacterium J055]
MHAECSTLLYRIFSGCRDDQDLQTEDFISSLNSVGTEPFKAQTKLNWKVDRLSSFYDPNQQLQAGMTDRSAIQVQLWRDDNELEILFQRLR